MESAIVTKDSFRDWKANPVTKAVFNDLQDRIIHLYEELGGSAGIDPLQDRFTVGAIKAYQDMLRIEVDEVANGN